MLINDAHPAVVVGPEGFFSTSLLPLIRTFKDSGVGQEERMEITRRRQRQRQPCGTQRSRSQRKGTPRKKGREHTPQQGLHEHQTHPNAASMTHRGRKYVNCTMYLWIKRAAQFDELGCGQPTAMLKCYCTPGADPARNPFRTPKHRAIHKVLPPRSPSATSDDLLIVTAGTASKAVAWVSGAPMTVILCPSWPHKSLPPLSKPVASSPPKPWDRTYWLPVKILTPIMEREAGAPVV